MNEFQRALLARYADGEYAGIINSAADLPGCGDTLLSFLFNELDDDLLLEAQDQGIEPKELAMQRLTRAANQITEVIFQLRWL